MSRVITWGKTKAGMIVWISVVLTLIMPWVIKFAGGSVAFRVGFLFILVNMIWAIIIGRWLRSGQLPWWYSLILPVLFAVMVVWRFARYDYFFVVIYLVLTLLARAKD